MNSLPATPVALPLVYLVEDDPLVADTIVRALAEFGFRCESFRTGAALIARVRQLPPALCIVDLGLPDGDGLDRVRELRAIARCGVLILSGRAVLADRVIGLELGADDYMVKPFEPRELVARVRSILRRIGEVAAAAPAGDTPRAACFEGWRFEPDRQALMDADGVSDELSTAEARLLLAFVQSPNRILSRERLAGTRELSPLDRAIDVRVSRLRRKLRDDPQSPRLIKTVYGAGYLFSAEVSWR